MVLGPHNPIVYGIHSIEDPAQSTVLRSRQMDTRNGVTRQLLSGDTGAGNHPQALSGGMAQEANAQSNVQDKLTWVGYQGR